MDIRLHDDVTAFAALAGPVLEADPVRHTNALTVLSGLRSTGEWPAALVTVHDGDVVRGVAMRAAGRPLHVSALPLAAAPAVDTALAAHDPEPPGVSGPVPEVEAYVQAHSGRTGRAVEVAMRMRLHVLGDLVTPVGVLGTARLAGEADLDLLEEWRYAFAVEAIGGWDAPHPPRQVVARMLADGRGILLWESGGRPVAVAMASTPVAGMSRIGGVYTPPALRGRGYASAVTAAASAWALRAAARYVVLFTDLANPVSNAIYPRLGYRSVQDALEVRFS